MKNAYFLFIPFLISCTQSSQVIRDREPSAEGPSRIIDAHTHFHSIQTKNLKQPSQEMLKEFEEAGVVGAVVHLGKDEHRGLVVDRGPKAPKLAVCAAVVPGGETAKEIQRGIEKKTYQCMKVYLGYVPKWASDSFYTPYYKVAQKMDVPVVFHTGDTYDKMAKVKYADPLGVDEVAVTFPNVKFVVAHMGNPWFDSAAEVVYKNDNVYVDMSALMLDDVSKLDPESVEELIIKPIRWFFFYVENPKKFMFATDWPLLKIKPYMEAIKRAIPKKHWDDVFYWNAATLFKLDKKH